MPWWQTSCQDLVEHIFHSVLKLWISVTYTPVLLRSTTHENPAYIRDNSIFRSCCILVLLPGTTYLKYVVKGSQKCHQCVPLQRRVCKTLYTVDITMILSDMVKTYSLIIQQEKLIQRM